MHANKKLFIYFILLLIVNCSKTPQDLDKVLAKYLPSITDSTHFVVHTGYAVQYNHAKHDPAWVAYYLTPDRVVTHGRRHGEFVPDPLVRGGTANTHDYSRSGYDRGHQAPAADFKWNDAAEDESFYMSNVCPQKPELNRGIWEDLEKHVRYWAKLHSLLYIVTGPVLAHCDGYIGSDNVCVPEYFFKVVLDCQDMTAIGFVMKNEGSAQSLSSFVVTVDSVEKISGIHFFASLPPDEARKIETHVDAGHWKF
jgi:endonuclease G